MAKLRFDRIKPNAQTKTKPLLPHKYLSCGFEYAGGIFADQLFEYAKMLPILNRVPSPKYAPPALKSEAAGQYRAHSPLYTTLEK